MITGAIKLFDTHKKYTYCYLGGWLKKIDLFLDKKE